MNSALLTDTVTTVSQLFLHLCRTYHKPDQMLSKIEGFYRPISGAEIETRVRRLSLGLRALGLRPGDKVIILSENRPEWVITDFAILCAGAVTVPIYTSLMPEQIRFLINDSEAKIIVCSNRDLWLKVEAVRSGLLRLEHAVLIDEEPRQGLLTLSEVMSLGTSAADCPF